MGSLLASRSVLAGAWIVVLAVLAGALAFAFLQPPPPPRGEPLTIVIVLPEAPAPSEGAAQTAPANEAAAGAVQATQPAAAPGTQGQAEPDTTPEPPPTAEAAAEPEAAPQDAPAAVAALPLPKPQAPAPQSPISGVPEDRPADAAEPETQALVTIPAVPPAIEQLRYWERYRQPFNMDDKRPRIAVVLSGLGLSDSATEAAIAQLPAAVTLSFSPYARDLERWIALARARGHEVMLDLPMEPATFPNEDPGPQGLLTGLSPEANLDRLDWVLSRGSAYVGLAGSMGSRFTASREALEPILREIEDRGLIFLDRRTTEDSLVAEVSGEIGLPHAVNSRSVDERQASRIAIDARLAQIERIALTEGFAVAMAQPYPVTLERLGEWTTELTSRGFALAPISALADRQKRP